MEVLCFTPANGGTPLPDTLPTLLQIPIYKLKQLSCVLAVTTGATQDNTSLLQIKFKKRGTMDYKKALDCFKVQGLTTKALIIDMHKRFLQIKMSTSKTHC